MEDVVVVDAEPQAALGRELRELGAPRREDSASGFSTKTPIAELEELARQSARACRAACTDARRSTPRAGELCHGERGLGAHRSVERQRSARSRIASQTRDELDLGDRAQNLQVGVRDVAGADQRDAGRPGSGGAPEEGRMGDGEDVKGEGARQGPRPS